MAGDASDPTDIVEELPYLLSLKSSDAVLSKVPKGENKAKGFRIYHYCLLIFRSQFHETAGCDSKIGV